MTITQIRNKLIALLWDYMGLPIILSDQVQPEAELPYGIYSITTSYTSTGELGDYRTVPTEEGAEVARMEMPIATYSFTFCSQNRTGENGEPIYGADEAEELASKAIGWFQHVGYDDISKLGITVVEVGPAQNRTTLVIDEAARRVGFDVRIRYTRVDTRKVSVIERTQIIKKERNE